MKKLIPLFLAIAVCVWAADFWQAKPFTDWDPKEVQKVENSSPWAKDISIGQGDRASRPTKGGGGLSEEQSPGQPLSGNGTAHRAESQGRRLLWRAAAAEARRRLIVSWRTALPVRQAMAKAKYGAEAGTSPDAKKFLEDEQKFYAVLVNGVPGRLVHDDNVKDALLKETSLNVKGKDPIVPSDLQILGNGQRAGVVFIFPRTTPLTLDDKEVEFSTKFGAIPVKMKFRLKDMVFNGKLEL